MASTAHMPAMPLSLRRAGETATVTKLRGDADMKRHLANIGFVEGSEVHVVSSSVSNIIVMVKGARFGLDTKVAQRIMTA